MILKWIYSIIEEFDIWDIKVETFKVTKHTEKNKQEIYKKWYVAFALLGRGDKADRKGLEEWKVSTREDGAQKEKRTRSRRKCERL